MSTSGEHQGSDCCYGTTTTDVSQVAKPKGKRRVVIESPLPTCEPVSATGREKYDEGEGATGEGAGRLPPRPETGSRAPREENGSSITRENSPPEDTLDQEETEQSNRKTASAVERGWGELDDVSRQSHDDLSLSGGMLLRDLDGSTLEPPSPEPPSPEQQGSPGTDTCTDGEEQQQQQQQQDTTDRRKRTMTSQYVR